MTDPTTKEKPSLSDELTFKAHEASQITCIVNQDFSEKVLNYLCKLGLEAYVENGRSLREFIKPRGFGVANGAKLRGNQSSIIRVTVPKACAEMLIESIVAEVELYLPGRGSIFYQNVIEHSAIEPSLNVTHLQKFAKKVDQVHFLDDLSYVTCVLSGHESGERLAKAALDLGVCVPLITYGTGNDIRDQLGLIRITISPDKELVHLLIPQHDSESIIKLLAEESRLDRPGRGYMYQTPVVMGLLDTRLKVGKQNHAASIDQIIAAIDTLKRSTEWRKRLDAEVVQDPDKIFLPTDNCKISVISREDAVGELREAWVKAGALGAVTSHLSRIIPDDGGEMLSDFVISEMSVSDNIKKQVINHLLEVCDRLGSVENRIYINVR
ncbi:hypothetical protein AAOE16_08255 [Ekhidna sp. MALMAid0563]|uniref:hypothetical protein n=1 Tax=Ekhidna sp. MALMAid0563 TaxID=3143937 RepID=UPI0032DF90F4